MTTRRPKFFDSSNADWLDSSYDLGIFALGFESRSTHFLQILEAKPTKKFAFGFDYAQDEQYKANKAQFHSSGTEVIDNLADSEFENELQQKLRDLKETPTPSLKILIDISCFNRFRLASLVSLIFNFATSDLRPITVDFVYSIAKFEAPSKNRLPNLVVGPAHPAFAGWSQGGYSSTAAVLGLGYEQDQAFGVVEFLQAGEVWAFSPTSPVEGYEEAVKEANGILLSEIRTGHVLAYEVCSPKATIATLDSVVRGLIDEHSVVLIPFGPKIFVLCTLIVAAMRSDVAVWRVSQGSTIQPSDRHASSTEVGLRMQFALTS